jgi:hypothetical protein
MAMRLLTENREILTDSLPINTATGNLVHIVICSACRCAPVYSKSSFVCREDRQAPRDFFLA